MFRNLNKALTNKNQIRHFPSKKCHIFLPVGLSTSSQNIQMKRTLASEKPTPCFTTVETNPLSWMPSSATANKENDPENVKLQYEDGFEYNRIYSTLVDLEEKFIKVQLEKYKKTVEKVLWEVGDRKIATFSWTGFVDENLRLMNIGDNLILTPEIFVGHKTIKGYRGRIVSMPDRYNDDLVLEMETMPPLREQEMSFVSELDYDSTSFDRLRDALKIFSENKKRQKFMKQDIYEILLGKGKPSEIANKMTTPSDIDVSGLPKLNFSQTNAVRKALSKSFTLIQGPPGTGKTLTAATVVYHIVNQTKGRVLVCAPSNIAVDNLAEKIASTGLKVVRVSAHGRDLKYCTVSSLELQNKIKGRVPFLDQLMEEKQRLGRLKNRDQMLLKKIKFSLEMKILSEANVICCTCSTAASEQIGMLKPWDDQKFQCVLIDESTQAMEPETLVPIMKGTQKVVLIGDHKQLGPTIMSPEAVNFGLSKSLFERLVEAGHEYFQLEEQYRMHPAISSFPRKVFYDGLLQDGITHEHRKWLNVEWNFPVPKIPIMFWNVNGKEEQYPGGTSYFNRVEAENIARLVKILLDAGVSPGQLGIITPYEAQRANIVHLLMQRGIFNRIDEESNLFDNNGRIEIANVDSFQGREKDITIISSVRSNKNGDIGFLNDERRLNVTLTRAKYGLIIVGNAPTLSRNITWRSLLNMYQEQNCLVEGTLNSLKPLKTSLFKASQLMKEGKIRSVDEIEEEESNEENQVILNDEMSKKYDAEVVKQYAKMRKELQLAEENWTKSDREVEWKTIYRDILEKHGKRMLEIRNKHEIRDEESLGS